MVVKSHKIFIGYVLSNARFDWRVGNMSAYIKKIALTVVHMRQHLVLKYNYVEIK